MAALLIANTAVTISEFAGIASGLALFGVPASISVPLVALLVWMLTMSGSFQRIEKILLLVSCVFVTYIVAAFMAGPNWGEVAGRLGRTQYSKRPQLRVAGSCHDRHHHCAVDDFFGAEQRGR